MPTTHPTETEEWLAARIDSWVETYKKAMLTPVVLQLISADEPASVAEITHRIRTTTGWEITERGLYRTLKRLQDSQLLDAEHVNAPRTGAKRKNFTLTPLGEQFLAAISENLIETADITGGA